MVFDGFIYTVTTRRLAPVNHRGTPTLVHISATAWITIIGRIRGWWPLPIGIWLLGISRLALWADIVGSDEGVYAATEGTPEMGDIPAGMQCILGSNSRQVDVQLCTDQQPL